MHTSDSERPSAPTLPNLDALSPQAQAVLGDTLRSLFRVVPLSSAADRMNAETGVERDA